MLQLVSNDNELLKSKLADFDFSDPLYNPKDLVQQMVEVCKREKGLAVSANQVGLPFRVFVIYLSKERTGLNDDQIIPVFNPKIVDTFGEDVIFEEGCLSYPLLFLKIKRKDGIRVRMTGEDGITDTFTFNGMTSRIFQHEYDHMEGINFTQRASKIHLSRAREKARIYARKLAKKKYIK